MTSGIKTDLSNQGKSGEFFFVVFFGVGGGRVAV